MKDINLYRLMYTSAWFFVGMFSMFLFDHVLADDIGNILLDLFIIGLNLYNQSGLWGRE